jgi:hypothetical protein
MGKLLKKFIIGDNKMKDKFITEFNRVRKAMDEGKTPVYSELRSVKTTLLELIPSLLIQSILLVISTILISKIQVSEITAMVILLVANTTTQTLSFAILVLIKHAIRVKTLKRHGLEINERNIAVLESMEYQSV